tara:strand:+ start:619 stop:1476 length:858 start_codon:yes stop_codon:yes gene_type:complete
MIKNILILFLFVNSIFAIGLKALIIPQSALTLGGSSTGIADNISVDLNPASLVFIEPYLGFSKNNWFGDLNGQKISVVWNEKNKSYFSFESLSIADIELRDEVASENPIGFFGAFWYAFDLSKTIDIKSLSARNFYFGYKVKFNLSKLYTESMYGGTVDFGIIKKMSNNLSVGFVTKNLGKEYYNNTSFNTDMTIGLGASYKLKIPIKILSDILYVDSDVMTKLSLITEFPYINVVCGLTNGKSYNDFSVGLHMIFNDWSFVFSGLKHDNNSLGSPTSIELIKTF